jgi:hypothetical protein
MIQSHQILYGTEKMTFDKQNLDIDPTLIILGLGYASMILIAIGWIAGF